MCGLAGIFHQADQRPIDSAALHRMTAALAHRGPDGDGFYIEPGVGLGHRRLAIIDPTGGEQPMYNEDRSVVIVFNGMIYNFQSLFPRLREAGHVFRTKCDTEAIIHAWEEWGPDCVGHLNGMFAFAIWDRNRETLFLARDRLGKKPLHYAHTADGSLVFASELGALAGVPGLARRIDPLAVDDYFTFGYVPDPATIYTAIRKLPAAHTLLLRRGGPVEAPRRYWAPQTATHKIGEAEAARELVTRLGACVGERLVADVPLGAFLSGGLDSSAVVALAAGLRTSPLDTVTICFEGEQNETPYAEQVATRYATNQHSDTTTLDYIAAAAAQGRIYGEPFGDHSSVPTLAVCALAHRYAKVAVSGDGGDEVFAGYRRYQWHRMTEGVRAWLPAGVRRHALGQLARAYPKMDWAPRWLRAKYTLTELSLDSALGYIRMVTKLHHDQRRALFAPALAAGLDGYDPGARIAALMEESGSEDPLVQAQYADINTYLVGDILTKVDRASMANSLEVRAPLLDAGMVDWGLGLPAGLKLRGTEGKYIFKRAMEPYLPREILYRRKQGFATTLAPVLRQGTARVRAALLGPAMLDSGLFRADTIAGLIDAHDAGRADHSQALWQLLVFAGFLAGDTATATGGPPAMASAGRGD
ncbi:MAG: amidotransferase 1, exosortase A system-associated [Rhodospirillales bacterium]|nr:amidotransferase 1, exosortase A system-associated [Rhodospirillales bacterium]